MFVDVLFSFLLLLGVSIGTNKVVVVIQAEDQRRGPQSIRGKVREIFTKDSALTLRGAVQAGQLRHKMRTVAQHLLDIGIDICNMNYHCSFLGRAIATMTFIMDGVEEYCTAHRIKQGWATGMNTRKQIVLLRSLRDQPPNILSLCSRTDIVNKFAGTSTYAAKRDYLAHMIVKSPYSELSDRRYVKKMIDGFLQSFELSFGDLDNPISDWQVKRNFNSVIEYYLRKHVQSNTLAFTHKHFFRNMMLMSGDKKCQEIANQLRFTEVISFDVDKTARADRSIQITNCRVIYAPEANVLNNQFEMARLTRLLREDTEVRGIRAKSSFEGLDRDKREAMAADVVDEAIGIVNPIFDKTGISIRGHRKRNIQTLMTGGYGDGESAVPYVPLQRAPRRVQVQETVPHAS